MQKTIKRMIDICLSGLGLVIASPVFFVIALIIKFTSPGPVFFIRNRVGKDGRVFRMYKFRTMTDARDSQGMFLPDADRLTRLGGFLRSFSIDELPELFNVIKGEMSLVGPRPLLVDYLPRYSPEQMRRHEVLPGLTGWAQINGRNAVSGEQKFKLDVWYVDNCSLRLDIRILLMTIHRVLKKEGISQTGQATMEEFKKSIGR